MKTPAQMMDILLASLIEELRDRDALNDLCAKSLYPGSTVPADYGNESCGGLAWVQLASAVPSARFPDQATDLNTCTYSLAYTMNMGIIRPVKIPEQVGRGGIDLPTDEENAESTYRQLEDMDIMHQAIRAASRDIDYVILGGYAPEGPEGGVVAGSWTVTVGNEDAD